MKRRWIVEWTGVATLYGFTLMAADPVHSRHWTKRGAERKVRQLESRRQIHEGAGGRWTIRRRA